MSVVVQTLRDLYPDLATRPGLIGADSGIAGSPQLNTTIPCWINLIEVLLQPATAANYKRRLPPERPPRLKPGGLRLLLASTAYCYYYDVDDDYELRR